MKPSSNFWTDSFEQLQTKTSCHRWSLHVNLTIIRHWIHFFRMENISTKFLCKRIHFSMYWTDFKIILNLGSCLRFFGLFGRWSWVWHRSLDFCPWSNNYLCTSLHTYESLMSLPKFVTYYHLENFNYILSGLTRNWL